MLARGFTDHSGTPVNRPGLLRPGVSFLDGQQLPNTLDK